MCYLLDANVLIAAHENYYAPDICPGFWDFTADKISQGELVIIDEVHKEIKSSKGSQKLMNWVNQASQGLLASTQADHVKSAYDEVMDWVKGNQQFFPQAKKFFAKGADGWLVAYAMAEDITVVTNETYEPNAKNRIKIPNVCKKFSVPYMNTYEMLRTLKASFKW